MSQDVEESSERCEGMMIQEVHAVPFRYEGRMKAEEGWRKKAEDMQERGAAVKENELKASKHT